MNDCVGGVVYNISGGCLLSRCPRERFRVNIRIIIIINEVLHDLDQLPTRHLATLW